MSQISQLVKKNFRILVKNKFSLFILFFLPLIIFLILGSIYYNQNSYNLNVGFVKLENNSLYNYFYNSSESTAFNTYEYSTQEGCFESLKSSKIHVCILFPDNFTISDEKVNRIYFYFDNSKSSVINVVENQLLTDFEKKTYQIKFDNIRKIMLILEKSKILLEDQVNVTSQIAELINKTQKKNLELSNSITKISKEIDLDNLELSDITEYSEDFKDHKNEFEDSFKTTYTDMNELVNEINIKLNNMNSSGSDIDYIESRVDTVDDQLDQLNIEFDIFFQKDALLYLPDKIDELTESLEDLESEIGKINAQMIEDLNMNENYSASLVQQNAKLNSIGGYLLDDINNLEINSIGTLTSPVEFVSKEVISDENAHINAFFPALIATLVAFLSLFFSANLSFIDKNSKAVSRSILTNVSTFKFVAANIITVLIMVFIQIGMILLLYSIIFMGLDTIFIFPKLMFVLIFLILVFASIGLFIGTISSSQNSYYLYLFLVLIYFFLGSGRLLPIELISSGFVKGLLTVGNPYLITETLLRKMILFEESMFSFISEIIVLICVFILFAILNYLANSYQKRREMFYLITTGLRKLHKYIDDKFNKDSEEHESLGHIKDHFRKK